MVCVAGKDNLNITSSNDNTHNADWLGEKPSYDALLCFQVLFGKGMRQFGKNFTEIRKELLPKKKMVRQSDHNDVMLCVCVLRVMGGGGGGGGGGGMEAN